MVATAATVGMVYGYVPKKRSDDPRVQAVFTRPKQDDPVVWIITEPLTHAEELASCELPTEVFERFPDMILIVHLIHAGKYENDPMNLVMPDAEQQPLHRQ